MARATAHRLGARAVFSPMPAPEGVGNGVHIHLSLNDRSGAPVTHAPDQILGLSRLAQHFCAGILEHLPAICAVTAPSPASYLRLTPNRWAPTAIDIQRQDRGAALRVCPVFAASGPTEAARQFNVEFRVADAAASPYLALGAVLSPGRTGSAARFRCARQPKRRLPCRAGSPRRSTIWRRARRRGAGSAQSSLTPISASSVPRLSARWGSIPPSSVPAVNRRRTLALRGFWCRWSLEVA